MQLESAINDQALADVVWEKIAAPALVVRGDADSWVAPDVAAKVFSQLPHSELRIMPGVARLAPEDAPVVLADLLRTWIGPETQAN
jgi:pimeloyl-ACP methyl ester carboxylesterase